MKKRMSCLFLHILISVSVLPSAWAVDPITKGPGNLTVRLMTFASDLGGDVMHVVPTDLVPLNDGTGRLAVSTITGVVRLLDVDGNFLDSTGNPYLDTRGEPNQFIPNNFGFGMTGIVFHPDFAKPDHVGFGKLYTILTETHHTAGSNPNPPDLFDGLAEAAGAHHDVLVEWTASDPSSNNPMWTRRDVVRMEQPNENHNVADITFDQNSLLYAASGDGGAPARFTAPQDVTTYIGKMLRIDPTDPSAPGLRSTSGSFIISGNGQYRIPMTNPGIGIPIEVDEVFAYGLRSPYRFNFDRQSGDLFLADVGEGDREEVNRIELDGNYGWGRWEGTSVLNPGVSLLSGSTHSPPVFEYDHTEGETVIGGFVYRGSLIPDLVGKYVFAEFGRQVTAQQQPTPARLFYGDLDTGEIFEFNLHSSGEQLSVFVDDELTSRQFVLSIGEDANGELYLVAGDDPQLPIALEPDGRIVRILPIQSLVFTDGFESGDTSRWSQP